MCGICGIVDFKGNNVEESRIRTMMASMKHRGPDDEGVFLERDIGLGFVRLSIIDLSDAGHQPMASADGRYLLVFNGEIFNYIELREDLIKLGYAFKTQTDSEVLLTAYQAWGEECLHRFNGMWAFVILDRTENKIFGARDRYGIKPLYYYLGEDQFIFSSELPPILRVFNQKIKPNNLAIFDFLVFNRTDHDNSTFFEKIYRVPHGSKFIVRPEKSATPEFTQWYRLEEQLRDPFKNSAEFYRSLSSAIGLRLRSDVPVGVCLSGGLDSSTIVSILLKEYNFNDVNSFSTIYGKGQFGDELEYINEFTSLLQNMYYVNPTAESLAIDLTDFIRAHAEPLPSTSPYAQYKVMELSRGHVVVTLDGQGADELLAGYHYFYGFYFKELFLKLKWLKLTRELILSTIMHKSLHPLKTFIFFMLPKNMMFRIRVLQKGGYLENEFYNLYRSKSHVTEDIYGSKSLKQSLIDHFNYKLEHLLKWEDRNSMWFSLEARVPFLDHRFVEQTLSMPSETKINNGWTKHILRESTKGMLPDKIRLRKSKLGFGTPEADWFRSEIFRKIITGILESESFKNRGIIDVKKAKSMYHNHLKQKANHSMEIWQWINLELWFREFIDHENPN